MFSSVTESFPARSSVVIVSLLMRSIAVKPVAWVRSNVVRLVKASMPDKSVTYSLSVSVSIASICSSVRVSRKPESAAADDTSELVIS